MPEPTDHGRWEPLPTIGPKIREWRLEAKCDEYPDGTIETGVAVLRWWAGDDRYGPRWTIEDSHDIEWTADDLEAAARIIRTHEGGTNA